mmetsp:Transcript_22549/g.58347  ORF Transcript_22549/g.58347 Transcript_22549/m.58347 type:complete len:373 (-) Transcript_22549:2036-3154(-)
MIFPMPRAQPSRKRRASPGVTYSGLYKNLNRTVARCPSRITVPLAGESALPSAHCPDLCSLSCSSSSAAAAAADLAVASAPVLSTRSPSLESPSSSAGQWIAVICAHCEIVCTCTTGSYLTLIVAGWWSSTTSAVNSNAASGAARQEADGERSTMPLCLRPPMTEQVEPSEIAELSLAPSSEPPVVSKRLLDDPPVPPFWGAADATANVALWPPTAVLAGLPLTWIEVMTTVWNWPCWSGPSCMGVPPVAVPACTVPATTRPTSSTQNELSMRTTVIVLSLPPTPPPLSTPPLSIPPLSTPPLSTPPCSRGNWSNPASKSASASRPKPIWLSMAVSNALASSELLPPGPNPPALRCDSAVLTSVVSAKAESA